MDKARLTKIPPIARGEASPPSSRRHPALLGGPPVRCPTKGAAIGTSIALLPFAATPCVAPDRKRHAEYEHQL